VFGPPRGVTHASTWPCIDHLASGLRRATLSPCSDSVSLRLQHSNALTLLHIVTRRLILQKARHHSLARALTACKSMVSGSLSLPSPGFFSPFPHGTSSLSVATSYLALDRGRPGFRQDFSCPVVLRCHTPQTAQCRVRDFHPLRSPFPAAFRYQTVFSNCVGRYAPAPMWTYNTDAATVHTLHGIGLGSSPFARRY
jgi:hypothetical protein